MVSQSAYTRARCTLCYHQQASKCQSTLHRTSQSSMPFPHVMARKPFPRLSLIIVITLTACSYHRPTITSLTTQTMPKAATKEVKTRTVKPKKDPLKPKRYVSHRFLHKLRLTTTEPFPRTCSLSRITESESRRRIPTPALVKSASSSVPSGRR